MSAASLTLPYAIPEKNRKKAFSANMELAAVVCHAEARRKKQTLVGVSDEKVMFVSKLCYPLWAVPWEKESLVVDGLQISSATLRYMALPDLEQFHNDIEHGKTIRELFKQALEKHTQTFASFSEAVEVSAEAILTDEELLKDISEYVEETLALKVEETGNPTLVSPRINKDGAGYNANKIRELYQRIQSDVKGLEYTARLLGEAAHFHEQKIIHEIQLVKEAFKQELDKVRPVVEKKIEFLIDERDARIGKMKRAAEASLNVKMREKERRHLELEKLELQCIVSKRKLSVRRSRNDKVGITRWEHKLRMCENRISEVHEGIHDLSIYIGRINNQSQEDIDKVKYNYQTLIDRERRKITDIEVSLESSVRTKESENTRLQAMTQRVIGLIEQMREQKIEQSAQLKSRVAIQWKPEQTTLIAVPFYLVGYKAEDMLRYEAFSPVKATSPEGIVKKIEKALLSFRVASRIKLLLQPRAKTLSKMLSAVAGEKSKTDKSLCEALRDAGSSHNILATSSFRQVLTEGLKELAAEGWIKQDEGEALLKMYA